MSNKYEQIKAFACLKSATQGVPITENGMQFCTAELRNLHLSAFLRKKNGIKWMIKFCNKNKFSFNKTNKQVYQRFNCANAKFLTTHINFLGQILEDLSIYSESLFNFDEARITTTMDCYNVRKKSFMSSVIRSDNRFV